MCDGLAGEFEFGQGGEYEMVRRIDGADDFVDPHWGWAQRFADSAEKGRRHVGGGGRDSGR
jgi:hypothetical protein